MTTKILSGSYPSGYNLQDGVTLLTVTSTGHVSSTHDWGIYTAYGHTRTATIGIQNYGVIEGPFTGISQGIYIRSTANVVIVNGSVADTTAYIFGNGNAIATRATGTSLVANFGKIAAQYGPQTRTTKYDEDEAIVFDYGGTVNNGSPADTSALILAGYRGVAIFGGTGTVTNYGAIVSTIRADETSYKNARGVYLDAGGSVTNGSASVTTALIRSNTGVYAKAASVVVGNYGTIIGEGYHAQGVNLTAGGAVTNGSNADSKASITGVVDGVDIAATGTVKNFGQITATGVGVRLSAGTVTNGSAKDAAAVIEGRNGVVAAAAATVINYDAILGVGGAGVMLNGGGGVLNTLTGLIEGSTGVQSAGAATIYNFGAIQAVGGYGANFNGGKLFNGVAGLVQGAGGAFAFSDATVVNSGVIRATSADGVFFNQTGTVANGGAGYTHALIQGSLGVRSVGAASVANFGAIQAYHSYGVELGGGGTVVNGSTLDTTAAILGYLDAIRAAASATVTNYGSIVVTKGYGVLLEAGGGLTNGSANDTVASIRGQNGIALQNGGTATNFGTIQVSGRGAYGNILASLTNGSAGDHAALIAGATGAFVNFISTLDNFGTVIGTGGIAASLGDSNSELVVEAGSAFVGQVIGNRGRLVLGSGVGTVQLLSNANEVVSGSMPTTTFTNFGAVTVASGAAFTLSGLGVVPAYNSLNITGSLSVGGELEVVGNANPSVSGTASLTGTLSGAGTLLMYAGGVATIGVGASLKIAKVTTTGTLSAVTIAPSEALAYAGVWTQNIGTTLSLGTGATATFTGVGNAFRGTFSGDGSVVFAAGTDSLAATTLHAYVTVKGTGAVTASGTITVVDALALNGGTLVIGIGTGGASFTGGTMALGDASHVIGASSTSTLVNINTEIIGGGQLGGGSMRLVNQVTGAIVAESNTAALTVDTGAQTIVNAGKFQSFGLGGMVIKSAISNSGHLIADGGKLTVDGAVTGPGSAQVGGATLDFASTFNENVLFGSENPFATLSGVLELSHSQSYHGTLSNFSKTGTTSLDLDDIAFVSGTTKATYSGTASGGTLTVTDGTHTAHILFAGDYTASVFKVSSDGHGGTTIVDPPKAAAVQRLAGAMAGFGATKGASAANHAGGWSETRLTLAAPTAHLA